MSRLQQVLLQSEEELLLSKRSSELAGEGAIPKPKKMVGKMKVQGKGVGASESIFSVAMCLNNGSSLLCSSQGENVTGPAYRMQFFKCEST